MSHSIPRFIWQAGESEASIPESCHFAVHTLIHQNPGWSYQFCSSELCCEFFQSFFPPDVARLYSSLGEGSLKSDILRFGLLYEFGGISCDLEVRCRAALDDWLAAFGDKGLHVGCETSGRGFCRHAIVSKPRHPVIGSVLEACLQLADSGADLGDPDPWSAAIHRFLGVEDDSMFLYHQRDSLWAEKDIVIHPCYYFDGVKLVLPRRAVA